MESEKPLLGSSTVPRYTFLGSGTPPKRKFWRFRTCLCTILIGVFLVVLVIALYYLLNAKYPKGSSFNTTRDLDGLLRLEWPLKEENYTELTEDSQDAVRALEAGIESLRERDFVEDMGPSLGVDTPAFRHALATHTSREAREMSRRGFVMNMASKEINKWYGRGRNGTRQKPSRWLVNRLSGWFPQEDYCRSTQIRCPESPYRTANGTCNNLENPTWGAALRSFRRILLPKYEDGVSEPRRASDGGELPSAREVSLAVHRPIYGSDVNFTVMLAVWGQFIDHDITATAISRGRNGSGIKCCQVRQVHPECLPVTLEPSDPFYLRHNVTCMEFVRSAPAPNCAFGPREQLNQATNFLDGSVVYGNDIDVMSQLRTFTGGELKMLKTPAGDLLPISEDPNDGCNRKEELARGRYCFSSGDKRSNENLLLTSMHLLFARHHNSIARQLADLNPHWEDEKLFQEARKITAAEMQHITYNEFLPSVLPEKLMLRLNISTRPSEGSSYDSAVNPTIANVFAAAAFRFGHTLLPGLMKSWRMNSTREEYLELHKMLFNPFEAFEIGFLENFMGRVMNTPSAKSDVHFSQEVSQKLFQKEPDTMYGLDLVSLNIQRGRDHGLPPYPEWRAACGLEKPQNFAQLEGEIEGETLEKLKKLYKSVDDLDLYTGGLAEVPLEGGLVGPTITCLVADQFLRLKIGDRFWYESTEKPQGFKPEQLSQIRKSSLAKIICRTSGVSQAQPRVMRRAGVGNEMKPCHEFSFPDLGPWREA